MRIYSPNITGSLIVTGSVNTTDAIEVREIHLRHDSGLIRMAVDNTSGQIKTVQANRGESVNVGSNDDFVSADPLGSGGSGAGFPFSGSAVITGSLLATAQVQSPIYFGTRETSSITVPAGTDALIIGETNATGSITLEEGATLNVVGDYSNLAKRDNDNTFNGNINVVGQVSASSYIGDGSQLSGIVTDNVENATSASFATTSSFAESSISSSFSQTASFSESSLTSSFSHTASIALNAEPPFPFTGSANISGSLAISEEFTIPTGTTSERPNNPSVGSMRFNTDTSMVEVYDGVSFKQIDFFTYRLSVGTAEANATGINAVTENIPDVKYLVIAGGGGGGVNFTAGGGGAGGYRSSVTSEPSGGGASAESSLKIGSDILLSTNYTVTVGAGGAGSTSDNSDGQNGSNSVFSTITSIGGGGGGSYNSSTGSIGGSGGGSSGRTTTKSSGTTGQGFGGGRGYTTNSAPGGGGGAGQAGDDGQANDIRPGDGGDGVESNITGTPTYRAGGGGSGGSFSGAAAGLGGGGTNGTSGTANTGGGGGGGYTAGSGGSGVVILRYPSSYSITVGGGLTSSTTTVGDDKVTTFTAGTDNISFS